MKNREFRDDPERRLRSNREHYMSESEYEEFLLNMDSENSEFVEGIENVGPVEKIEEKSPRQEDISIEDIGLVEEMEEENQRKEETSIEDIGPVEEMEEESPRYEDIGIEDIGQIEDIKDENKTKKSWDLSNWGMTKDEFNKRIEKNSQIQSKINEKNSKDNEDRER